ncbi:MAG TPA: glycosyltransferase family 87 protein, partial [bacterium]|nr:glycosyltransferase family 87 protein [bacterium]
RPAAAVLWALLAVTTVVQTARLGAFMTDPDSDWFVTTRQAFWSKHQCAVAYFYAADLHLQGEADVYDGSHYPGLTRDAEVHPTVEHLAPEDPYQYPPQFLLLPRLALALSDDFSVIRPVWYALQAALFLLVAAALARWYGGRAGRMALWLVPLLWISVPAALNFQYGQFHASVIALAMAAFLAFESGRVRLGGALLAGSILAKGFSGILVIPLLLQRRWREAAWTGAWAVAWTAVAFAVLGPDPFTAFFRNHVGNLASGASFAFEEAWPELRAALLAGNVSPFAAVRKLAELGVPGMSDGFARMVHGLFTVGCLVAAVAAARAAGPRARAVTWLALLNLAAMTSPAAWGDYVPVGTLWLVTLLAAGEGRIAPWALAVVGGFAALLPGVVPIGSFPGPAASMAVSIAGTVLLIAANARILSRASVAPAGDRSVSRWGISPKPV